MNSLVPITQPVLVTAFVPRNSTPQPAEAALGSRAASSLLAMLHSAQ
jgi:hypothetical protein